MRQGLGHSALQPKETATRADTLSMRYFILALVPIAALASVLASLLNELETPWL